MLHRLLCVAVGCILSSGAFAQGTAPPTAPTNPNMLQGIQQLQQNDVVQSETLQAILTAVQGLTPPPPSNILATPPFNSPGLGGIFCTAVNVSTAPVDIKIQVVHAAAGTITLAGTTTLQPGAHFASVVNDTQIGGVDYCLFTMVTGSRNDIRGSGTSLLNGQIIAVVGAQ